MQGDKRVDELMIPVLNAINRHVKDRDAKTDIYNRAYEAVINSMDVNVDTHLNDKVSIDLQARIDELTAENAALREQVVYVVTMYRYGDREKHSYVLGAFSTEATAREWGEKEKDYRGGKYDPEIVLFYVDSLTDYLEVKKNG